MRSNLSIGTLRLYTPYLITYIVFSTQACLHSNKATRSITSQYRSGGDGLMDTSGGHVVRVGTAGGALHWEDD